MRRSAMVVSVVMLLTWSGCNGSKEGVEHRGQSASGEKLVGADRDGHGCVTSAGFRWCERLRSCVRPWELAKEKGFANDPAAFKNYCSKREEVK